MFGIDKLNQKGKIMPELRRNGRSYSSGGSTSYKELTLAEYEALGDVVNSDGTLYFITDSNESDGNSAVPKWKLLKTVTGTTSITLPTEDYEELFVRVQSNNIAVTTTIPKIVLTSSAISYPLGLRGTAEYGSLVARINATNTAIKLNDAYYGASSISSVGSNCTLSVYYR